MSEGQTLKKYLKDNRITNAELARMVKTSAQNVGYHLKRAKIDDSFKYKLREAGVNIFDKDKVGDENLTPVIKNPDADHKTITKVKRLNTSTATAVPYIIMRVPLVRQYAYAGYLSSYADEEFVQQLEKIEFMVDKEYRGNYLSFEVRGDSMDDGSYDAYKEGNIVCCREINKDLWKSKLHINEWDFIIVHDESIVLKRIVAHDTETGTITVHSLNPFYADYTIDLREVKKLFNVVQTIKKRK